MKYEEKALHALNEASKQTFYGNPVTLAFYYLAVAAVYALLKIASAIYRKGGE